MSSDTFDKLKAKLAEVEALLSVTQKALKASEEDRVKVEAELDEAQSACAAAMRSSERLGHELTREREVVKVMREALNKCDCLFFKMSWHPCPQHTGAVDNQGNPIVQYCPRCEAIAKADALIQELGERKTSRE